MIILHATLGAPMAMAAASSDRADADRITFQRGRRRTAVALPRHGVLAAGLIVALLAAWSVAAAAYLIFHDTVVAELRHGAKAAAKGYEAQLAAMRDELERARTRRLVEKAGVDERLAELGRRQEAIEKRQSRLSELTRLTDVAPVRDPGLGYTAKPVPLDRPMHALDGAALDRPARSPAETVAASIAAVEAEQTRTLDALAAQTGERRRTLERVYDAARVRRPSPAAEKARGGPFEPLPPGGLSFETRADWIAAEQGVVATFEHGLTRVPLRTPAPGKGLSSGFGARVDPFLGRPAFHAGLDFEGEPGEPVRATAAGRVVAAGWSGGYGNRVEIDHGGGLTTRYGHLSTVSVREGEEVRIGSTLGRVGSTGRSTGPHLHYETRVDGEAVDPLRFLNAGRILVKAR
jgi:murein DD-endopeptidase MepM/ murein hydrolase activator NlpD